MTVELRDVDDPDLDLVYEHQRDVEACERAGAMPRGRDAFDERWEGLLGDPQVVARSVVADGEVVGHVLSFVRDGRPEVGYWIARSHWRQGIGSTALGLLLDELDERPLYAQIAFHNPASLRIAERHGFREIDAQERNGVRFCVLRLG